MDRKELSTEMEKIIKDVFNATENMLELAETAKKHGFLEASTSLRCNYYILREQVQRLDDPAILD